MLSNQEGPRRGTMGTFTRWWSAVGTGHRCGLCGGGHGMRCEGILRSSCLYPIAPGHTGATVQSRTLFSHSPYPIERGGIYGSAKGGEDII